MKIFAIDPGPQSSAYVLWDGKRVIEAAHVENKNLLFRLIQDSGDFIYGIEMVACYGMPIGREVFETCLWIGRFVDRIASSKGEDTHLVYRKDIKLHLCGTARAKDGNVAQSLRDKMGEKGTKANPGPLFGISKHLWAALAVADYIESIKS